MMLTPHVDALLVFDATDAEVTGEYAIYSIRPDENERFMGGEWDELKTSLEPTGRVPVTDVLRDDEKRETRIRTYALERFAATT
jgi:hypothetical protein